MSLSKLWNSLFGRPQAGQPTGDVVQITDAVESANAKPATAEKQAAQPITKPAKKRPPLPFAGRGPHSGLCKLIKNAMAAGTTNVKVLEIGVGDGSRSVAMLEAFSAQADADWNGSYVAIDTFEMEDGPIAMRDFHRMVRETGVKPQIFPMPLETGLMRVAHTIGAVDVIVVDPRHTDQLSTLQNVLAKLEHDATLVFQQVDGTWKRQAAASDRRRRAA